MKWIILSLFPSFTVRSGQIFSQVNNTLRWNNLISLVAKIIFLDLCECHLLPYFRTHSNININNYTGNSTVMTVPGDHVVHQSDRRNLNCRDRSWRICWSVNRFYISGRCGQGDKIHRWIASEMKQFHSVTSIHGDADETTVMFHWWTSTLVDKIQGGTLLRVNGLNRLCSIRGTWPGWKFFPQGSTELNSLV